MTALLAWLTVLGSPIVMPWLNAGGPGSAWFYPLDGVPRVVSAFAPPPAWAPWQRGNRGVDLAAAPGAVVHAAAAGVISFAGPVAGRGVVVVVHGPLRTTYEPVTPEVKVGDHVRADAAIGVVEAAPSPCPPVTCLHWGLLRGRTYLDPMAPLQGPVRLLPWSAEAVGPGQRLAELAALPTTAPRTNVALAGETARPSAGGTGRVVAAVVASSASVGATWAVSPLRRAKRARRRGRRRPGSSAARARSP